MLYIILVTINCTVASSSFRRWLSSKAFTRVRFCVQQRPATASSSLGARAQWCACGRWGRSYRTKGSSPCSSNRCPRCSLHAVLCLWPCTYITYVYTGKHECVYYWGQLVGESLPSCTIYSKCWVPQWLGKSFIVVLYTLANCDHLCTKPRGYMFYTYVYC